MVEALNHIRGLSQLDDVLKVLPAKVQKKALGKALRAGSAVIRKEASRRAPKATGKLRMNIRTRIKRRKNTKFAMTYQVYVRSQGIHQAPSSISRRRKIYKPKGNPYNPKNVWYWTFVEFGTRKKGARPFLRPAFSAKHRQAVLSMRDRLGPAILEEAKKLKRR
ncbi:HK97-gp10 family putative phage morphogenesis protein [Magnetococcus sp. PR-3]|uniref:HK97-gp10 family putative phage morphogenesis protein n=1 Tax=Magnetococcus sp. PR-3 TaxID=3120355 RepID=UPI002FCDF511